MPEQDNYDLSAGGSRTRIRQIGERTARHVAGRVAGMGSKALVVAPVLGGESLIAHHVWAGAATDSHVQVDSPLQVEWIMMYQPFDFLSQVTGLTIGNTTFDGWLDRITGGRGTNQEYGASPEVEAEDDTFEGPQLGLRASELLWSKETVLFSNQVAIRSDLAGLEIQQNHPQTRFEKSVGKNYFFPFPGFIIFGVKRYQMNAETNFGALNFDTDLSMLQWSEVFSAGVADWPSLNSTERAALATFYGGDTFIEADTWKEDDIRAHVLAQFRFATPFPERTSIGAS